MSQDWSAGWRTSGSGRGRGGRGGGVQLTQAQEARASLQEHFYRVDQLQSDIGGTVRQYAALLADRAASTGVVPGWTELDRRASELIVAYLEALDRHDPVEEAGPQALAQAVRAFSDLTPRLGGLAGELEGFLERFGPELARVGQARDRIDARVAAATAAVERAEAAWRGLGDVGLQFDAVDRAVAEARIAARKLTALAPRLTLATVEEPVEAVERLAERAHGLAVSLPRRAATLDRRIPSLATRVDALENRAAGAPDVLRILRREYAAGNWEDLATERDLGSAFDDVRRRLAELRRHHAAGDTAAALLALDEAEAAVTGLAEQVDAPQQRLDLLRKLSADPERLFEDVRFRLRDARYLIRDGRAVAPQPWAGRLDAAARALIDLEPLARERHPDWWGLHQRLTALDERVRTLIDDVRRRA